MARVELGDKVKDRVTGFTGIAVARTEWLNGCARVTIQPPLDKDKKMVENQTFDEPQLEILKEDAYGARRVKKTGGPIPAPKQKSNPNRW